MAECLTSSGVDIDASTRTYLSPLLSAGASDSQFLNRDFLKASPADFNGILFSTIFANPPYTRRSALQPNDTALIDNLRQKIGPLNFGKASYWAYFLLHSLSFLQNGGKMIFLLPTSLLQTDYGKNLCNYLGERFEQVNIVVLAFRAFREAQVSVAILLALNYGAQPDGVTVSIARNSVELGGMSNALSRVIPTVATTGFQNWRMMFLSSETLNIYKRLIAGTDIKRFEDIFRVCIGVVTGANEFFVVSDQIAKTLQIPDDQIFPVVSNGHAVRGLTFTKDDYGLLSASSKPSVILRLEENALNSEMRDYIKGGEATGLASRLKCSIRKPWYTLDDVAEPDAFFQYMKSSAPHLVLNDSGCTCTNALHRVNFRQTLPRYQKEFIAVSILTSVTQLTMELTGRSYGGGVLKMEPGTLAKVPLVHLSDVEGVDETFRICDEYLRKDMKQQAIRIADEFVLIKGKGIKMTHATAMQNAWKALVTLRLEHRK